MFMAGSFDGRRWHLIKFTVRVKVKVSLSGSTDVKVEPIKATLCRLCTECPSVEITSEGVTIGEDENIVRLTLAEWNELVDLIKRGKLREA
jgi:hypothetical protein